MKNTLNRITTPFFFINKFILCVYVYMINTYYVVMNYFLTLHIALDICKEHLGKRYLPLLTLVVPRMFDSLFREVLRLAFDHISIAKAQAYRSAFLKQITLRPQ